MRILTYILTPREFVKVLEEESGKKINYHEVTFEDFNKIKDVPEQHEAWAKYVLSSMLDKCEIVDAWSFNNPPSSAFPLRCHSMSEYFATTTRNFNLKNFNHR